ncbi:MAG: chromosome segregation protein SMC [Bacteroidota bacterium]|jgi:chromosome segregation protein|nr:chromosome segregation protein SMC [Bacteroidota bacterium]
MYLSKLEIFGFKSFANKTNVVLNNGVTAIVGPNGCGKTNIVDALRWALGEQRYSTLRSDKMEDVIFNGTKVRKPIGMAEVSLTIENNRGILPLEFNELTITRRVYRSGESEYLLNRTVCRLKDILNLFMDTGMGANAYSVIELKMIETILSDKMEERRRLFEEAAGVTKYKARRKEALRKLTDVDGDLLRVEDIIAEVSKTVNSLNRQAKKAERYNEYMERLRVLEVDVLQRDYNNLFRRLAPLEERLATSIEDRESMAARMDEEEALLDAHRSEEHDIEHRLDERRQEYSGLVARINETRQRLLVNEERERALVQRAARLKEDKQNYEVRITEIESRKRTLTQELESWVGELSSLEAESTALRETHHAIEEEVTQKKLQAERRQQRRLELLQSIAQLNTEIDRLDARHEAIDGLRTRLADEDADASENLSALRGRMSEQDAGQAALSDTVLAAEREFHAMEEHKQSLRNEIDQLQNRAFEIQGMIGEKMTRIDFINGLVDRLEGYNESVQHLLRNRDWSASRYGTIADAVNTREELRVAVEAVLGDAAHYILVNDVREAVSGLQNLKEHRKGKATFAVLSRVPETTSTTFPIAGDGIIGWAVDLVRFDTQYAALFNMLLRRVLIVRDAEVAHGCMREYPDLRCVTIDGDIFDSNGMVRGGSHGQEEGSMIGKKDQIASLTKDVERLKTQLLENQELLEDRNLEYGGIDLRAYAEKMKQTQQDLSAHERRIAQMMFEIEKFERVLQKNAEERLRLDGEDEEIAGRRRDLEPRREELRVQQTQVESDVQHENEVLAERERAYNQSNEALNAANVRVVQKRGDIQNLRNEFDRLSNSLHETERALETAAHEIVESEETAKGLVDVISRLRLELGEMEQVHETSREALAAIEQELEHKRSELRDIEKTLHDDRQKQSQTINLVHEIDLKVSEIKQRISALEERARDEFEITLERVEESEDDVFDLAQEKEEINDLRQKIRALGPVNPLAFEEWKEEKERLDLLTEQQQDLIQSQQTLRDTIREINETAKQKFSETFGMIRENFIKIFKSLFDEGDEADLILQEHEDPLEARIDIIAKPRGKRPHSIDMLSGGEKTLTAIALLFAIYLVKPSPFCILDEVDAPLDDANIDRFIKIIQEFSNNTQFIVVTHNKRTMAAADTLYGVTMEEEGISKLVAVDFGTEAIARFAQN